jgi:TetR/AcrR family transcriptional regulator, transcriptional repressor for nem operon
VSNKKERAALTRRQLIDAAAQEFRLAGYSGAGVDDIAKRAELTSGAFYRHFSSKSEIFAVVIAEGLNEIVEGIRVTKASCPTQWREAFTRFYFSNVRLKAIETGCVLPSLTAEVVRADEDAKKSFLDGINAIIRELSDDLDGKRAIPNRDSILAALALMAGGLMLARAAKSKRLADRIAVASGRKVMELLASEE